MGYIQFDSKLFDQITIHFKFALNLKFTICPFLINNGFSELLILHIVIRLLMWSHHSRHMSTKLNDKNCWLAWVSTSDERRNQLSCQYISSLSTAYLSLLLSNYTNPNNAFESFLDFINLWGGSIRKHKCDEAAVSFFSQYNVNIHWNYVLHITSGQFCIYRKVAPIWP